MRSEAESRPRASAGVPAGTGPWALAEGRWHAVFHGFFFLLPIVAVLAPRGLVPLLLAATLLSAAGVWRTKGPAPWPRPDLGLALALAVFVLWSAIASLWSFDPARALLLSVRVGCVLGAGLIFHGIVRRLGGAARRRIGRWLIAGTLVALALLIVETVSGFPIGHALYGAARLGGDPAVWLNRGAVAIAILCWPAAALLWRKPAKAAAAALIAGSLLIVSLLSSLAAITGLAVAAVFALASSLHRKAGRIILIAATLAALIGSPLAGRQFYTLDWQAAGWLPFSAQHRVEIWNFTMQRIAEKPVLGWGFDAARGMGQMPAGDETSGRSPVGWHPHNAVMQILLELGLVGAAIALGIAMLLIRRLEGLAPPERTFGQATYMAALIISCTAYGVWQNWWISLMICAAAGVVLASRPPAPLRGPQDRNVFRD